MDLKLSLPGRWAGRMLETVLREQVAQLLQLKSARFPGTQPVSFHAQHVKEIQLQE